MRLPLSIRVLLLLVLPGLAALPGAANGAFRCGSSLVDVGDWPVEVEERCGAPDYVATYPAAPVPGIGVVGEVEHWYYNPGPQGFIRRLEFRNGKLRHEHSLGYGFAGDSAGDCSPARLQSGLSEFEMVACWPWINGRRSLPCRSTGACGRVAVRDWKDPVPPHRQVA